MNKSTKVILIITSALIVAIVVAFGWQPVLAGVQKFALSLSVKTGLVGYWNFDSSASTTPGVTDLSGNRNHGTGYNGATPTDLSTASSTASGTGKLGNGGLFDGSDDYVAIADSPSLDISSAITLSAWVKRDVLDSNYRRVVNKTGEYFLIINTGNEFALGMTGGADFDTGYLLSGTGQWEHLVATFNDAADEIRLYLNGSWVQTVSTVNIITSGTGSANIGSGAGLQYFSGLIDEVRIYNRALSATEVGYLYRQGAGTKTAVKSPSKTGLVGYWNFDSSASTTPGVTDLSGNGNHGTGYDGTTPTDLSTASSTASGTGKLGNGGLFDGSDDWIIIPKSTTLNPTAAVTVSAWIKLDTAGNFPMIVSNGSSRGYELSGNSTTRKARMCAAAAGGLTCGYGNTVMNLKQWYFVAFTYDSTNYFLYVNGASETITYETAVNTGAIGAYLVNLAIGQRTNDASYPFDGLLDEVRIYNRALSADEVKALYDSSKKMFVNMPQTNLLDDGLVGFWSFNGQDINWGAANEILDRSGQGNDGDVSGFGKEAARPGISGQALSFDGSDDYIIKNTADWQGSDSSGTITAWIKAPSSSSGSRTIFSSADTAGTANYLIFRIRNGDDNLEIAQRNADTANSVVATTVVDDGSWHHVAVVSDGAAYAFYLDGRTDAISSGANDGDWFADTLNRDNIVIGELIRSSAGGTVFNGLIDEVRVYNRVLSAGEVLQLYNASKR